MSSWGNEKEQYCPKWVILKNKNKKRSSFIILDVVSHDHILLKFLWLLEFKFPIPFYPVTPS